MIWEYTDEHFFNWKIKLIQTNERIEEDVIWEYMVIRTKSEPIAIDHGFFVVNWDYTPTIDDVMKQFVSNMTKIAMKIAENV